MAFAIPLALAESSTAEWLSILVFIFGGCCSNVWALEAVLKKYPGSGTFLTFAQIVYVAFGNLAGNVWVPAMHMGRRRLIAEDHGAEKERVGRAVGRRSAGGSGKVNVESEGEGYATRSSGAVDASAKERAVRYDGTTAISGADPGARWYDWIPRLKARKVPLWRWGVQVVLFLGVSLLNNRAFAYKIPLTLHIIFRSGGLCVSMLTGRLMAGKRYTLGQAVAGVIITAGIVLATLSAPSRRPSSPKSVTSAADAASATGGASTDMADTVVFITGIGMLCAALVMSALLGLWQERIYKVYGTVWQEGLFYSHLLSIPFFAPFHQTINTTFQQYAATPPVSLSLLSLPGVRVLLPDKAFGNAPRPVLSGGIAVPSALMALVVNVVTQGFCIRGVNKLTARVSSTTVNLVLTVRKAVSLALSVWYYGSGVTPGLAFGGAMVLGGTIIYGLASPRTPDGGGKKALKEVQEVQSDMLSSGKSTGTSTAHAPLQTADQTLRHRVT